MAPSLLFVLQIILVVLSFKSIVCDSDGILSCESSTIDEYKCIWEAPSNSQHLTYSITSTSNYGLRSSYTPIKEEIKGNRTIYYFDSDEPNGGHYNTQTISVYSTDAAGTKVLVSDLLEFTPYTQAIPNTVTNVEFNVSETSIDVTWQKPFELASKNKQSNSRKLLYKLHYWNQRVNETTEMVDEQQYTIRGLEPHTTYSISLACRFKLVLFDDKAKWGKPTLKTVTTTGFTVLKEFSQWLYVSIGVIGGMALVIMSILFVVQTKRKCYNLDLNTSSEVLSYVRKWENLTYAPAKIDEEQYNELRHPQSTHLQAVSHQVAHPELSSVPDITAVQEPYEHAPFQNGDAIKAVDVKRVPTHTEDRMSDSFSQQYSYVKLNMTSGGFTLLEEGCQTQGVTSIDSLGGGEGKRNANKSKNQIDDKINYEEKVKNGYVPIDHVTL
ncbi:uncharacterized protein LOC117109829 [Anneissia japonica]|uniref:uncharacterized protein LOC117109829 n=1 Tax=Anneissia japonica TaxID=1529436 RepID=UPI0014256074|nr:uncharacterized protein LOC117109829 [Anneissia japonica]XP_033108150.1 uncharacterized protein LOC117109829 [Anneissia japonica]